MLQIIGFGEVVRFDNGTKAQKEMLILTPDGKEHSVPVSEDIVKKIIDIWLGAGKKTVAHPGLSVRPHAPAPTPQVGEVADDVGEVTAVATQDVPEFEAKPPVVVQPTSRLPRPRFLEEEDEDGRQI